MGWPRRLHGLAKKNAMMRDRRYTQMSPTARGAQLVSTADEAVDHSRMRLFSGIDDAEDTFLLESLTRLPSNATEGTAKLTTCA